MDGMIALSDWLGRYGDFLDPAELSFTAKQATGCRGCIFDNQRSEVCRKANAIAHLAGIADCDFGFVYIKRETDPRQLKIEG